MKKEKDTKKAGKQPNIPNVIEEIIKGDEEAKVLRRHRIAPETFDKLLNSPEFATKISSTIGLSIIRSKLLIAQYAQVATAKLISLTDCEKEETARKACLDVIALAHKQSDPAIDHEKVSEIAESGVAPISQEQASKMLAVLAKDESGKD